LFHWLGLEQDLLVQVAFFFFGGNLLSSRNVQPGRPPFFIKLFGQLFVARADVGFEVHAASELSVATFGRARVIAGVAAQVACDVQVLLQILLRAKRFTADTALVLRAFLVLLHVLAHNRGGQRNVIAFVALWEFGVCWGRHAVNREKVIQHVVAFNRPVPAKFTSL
jgi:hypothetical protein